MKRPGNNLRWPVVLLAAAFTFGCGSDGNDVVIDDDDTIVILPLYAYQLTSTSDDPVTVTVPLFEGGRTTFELGHLFDGPGLFGTYQPDDGAFTVEAGSSLVVSQEGPLFFNDFSVQATVDWFVPGDGNPDTGALEVTRGEEKVEVAVIDGGTTVRLRHDATGDGVYEESVELTWQAFEELDEFGKFPEWQLLGAFAYDVTLEYIFELAEFGIEAFDFLDDVLEQAGQVVVPCTAFSDLGLSVPPPLPSTPSLPDQGTLTFSWLDDVANGLLGPGDSFSMDFAACLDDDPLDDYDDMYTGTVGLNSLTEVYEQRAAGETLVRIGWEGPGVAGRPGGVDFDGLWLWEVWDADGDGPETQSAAVLTSELDGRMTLVFFEP